jgi:hypothetical protein
MRRTALFVGTGLFVLGLVVLAGCNNSGDPKPPDTKVEIQPPPAKKPEAEHAHKPGQHGGIIVEIGRDNYHAEAVFARDGVVRVYTLGKDEAVVQEVESQTLTAYARGDGDTEAVEFTLKAEPRADDAAGKTSQFVGTLPEPLRGRHVEVTVPTIRIEGTRYRFAFANAAKADGGEEMPVKVANDEERRLYLTAGGKYTEADIEANGKTTASIKFAGMKSEHNDDPQPGDRICPISKSKASAKFTWIVDGKSYEFCCPPCVDEFVKKAKEKPDAIKAPGEYVKK